MSNEIISHLDWLPTLLAMAGVPDVKEKLLTGYTAGKETYKVHLDGYNFLPYLTGEEKKGPRKEFFYFSDDGDLTDLRYDNWKFVFAEQRVPGTLQVWAEPFTHLRVPLIFNLRQDPLRARQCHVEHLLRLAARPRLHAGPGAKICRPIPGDLQGLSATPEGRELLDRSGAGEVAAAKRGLDKRRWHALWAPQATKHCVAGEIASATCA